MYVEADRGSPIFHQNLDLPNRSPPFRLPEDIPRMLILSLYPLYRMSRGERERRSADYETERFGRSYPRQSRDEGENEIA